MFTQRQNMESMLEQIAVEARATAFLTGRAQFQPKVMAAIRKVLREKFIPEELNAQAYANYPLPIGHSQTISQPYIVALMTDLLDLKKDSVVLEVGTGSGYQAAVLSILVAKVYTIERIKALYERATRLLDELGYHNIETKWDDGSQGWQDHAPFDAIIVTAAVQELPQELTNQLRPGGVLVAPVGEPYYYQELRKIIKSEDGSISSQNIIDVSFVPMIASVEDEMPT